MDISNQINTHKYILSTVPIAWSLAPGSFPPLYLDAATKFVLTQLQETIIVRIWLPRCININVF